MFIADLSYLDAGEAGPMLLNQAKLGVLSGSLIAAVAGCLLLNKTLPKSIDNNVKKKKFPFTQRTK
jgi:NhaA family Na+:H+ antiporter